jgi:CheY-like chemotaxis protein
MVEHLSFILVDDVRVNNVLAEHVLRKCIPSSKVVSFTDSAKALDYISQTGMELNGKKWVIFLDVYMPDVDGWEFLRRFGAMDAKIRSHFKVWILSSSISPADHERARCVEYVSGFIEKPLNVSVFARVMDQLQ